MKGWLGYGAAWLAAACFWTIAASNTGGPGPLYFFPYGVLIMGTAALMGVGVWHMTGRIPLTWRSRSFYLAHGIALPIYAAIYSTVWVLPDLVTGRIEAALTAIRTSPAQTWNVFMGGGVYLVVAGLSYAVRAQRRARIDAAAAAEARVLAQQAQLAALRARLNPHFLFNALHSVGALVPHDPVRADQAIESLGDLLRYALGTDEEVLFSQEWRFTQDYLAFEQLRLGDRLRINATASGPAMSVPVPPLILQPLVENAVRHGIADRAEGGLVQLSAEVSDSRLILRIADDGRGAGSNGGDGLGLASVRQRLLALYGGDASLDIDRRAGYAVTLVLPVNDAMP